MNAVAMPNTWEADISALLEDLSASQSEMLALLNEKRLVLMKFDEEAMAALTEREQVLIARLQTCLERRTELLARAESEGRPHNNLRDLTSSLPKTSRGSLEKEVELASSRARILQHHGITNWVLVQRTLIHLSQMLEIIATGGRSQPTYEKGNLTSSSGGLLDQAA